MTLKDNIKDSLNAYQNGRQKRKELFGPSLSDTALDIGQHVFGAGFEASKRFAVNNPLTHLVKKEIVRFKDDLFGNMGHLKEPMSETANLSGDKKTSFIERVKQGVGQWKETLSKGGDYVKHILQGDVTPTEFEQSGHSANKGSQKDASLSDEEIAYLVKRTYEQLPRTQEAIAQLDQQKDASPFAYLRSVGFNSFLDELGRQDVVDALSESVTETSSVVETSLDIVEEAKRIQGLDLAFGEANTLQDQMFSDYRDAVLSGADVSELEQMLITTVVNRYVVGEQLQEISDKYGITPHSMTPLGRDVVLEEVKVNDLYIEPWMLDTSGSDTVAQETRETVDPAYDDDLHSLSEHIPEETTTEVPLLTADDLDYLNDEVEQFSRPL